MIMHQYSDSYEYFSHFGVLRSITVCINRSLIDIFHSGKQKLLTENITVFLYGAFLCTRTITIWLEELRPTFEKEKQMKKCDGRMLNKSVSSLFAVRGATITTFSPFRHASLTISFAANTTLADISL
jgi:hypothetical protein